MKRKFVAIRIVMTILFAVLPILAQAAPVGKFTSVEGKVDVTISGKPAAPANPGDSLNAGDIIRTKSKSKCEVVFIDGSVLRLAENSRLRVAEFAQEEGSRKAKLDLFRGKVQNVVKTVTGGVSAASRYEVHTPTAVAGVRGTNFFSFYQGGVSGTVFKEGTGYGYSANRPDDIQTIRPGQAMLVTNPDMPPTIRPATENELNQHEKDTTPSEKPKGKGEKEQDKKPEGDEGGKAGEGKAEEQPKEKEPEPADKKGESPDGGEGKTPEPASAPAPEAQGGEIEGTAALGAGPTGSDEKIIEASFQADLNEGSGTVDVIPRQEPLPVADIGRDLKEIVEKDVVQETQQADAVAPIIAISPINFSNATGVTNQQTAEFAVTVTDDVSTPDKIALSYTLDGTVVDSPDIRQQLSEGNHAFGVTATDEAGKSATKIFAWITDYTPPVGNLAQQSLPKKVAGLDNHFDFTATDLHLQGSYCRIDAGEWIPFNGGQLTLAEGMKTIDFKGVDLAGNESPVSSYAWFVGANQAVLRDAEGGTAGGAVGGGLAGGVLDSSEGLRITTDRTAGGWLMEYGGTYEADPQPSFRFMAGGLGAAAGSVDYDSFWLSRTDDAAASAGGITGNSSFSYLSKTVLGTGTGLLTGTYGDGSWQATELGMGTYAETPLAWSGDWAEMEEGYSVPASLYKNAYEAETGESRMEFVAHDTGLAGGAAPFWNGSSHLVAMGRLTDSAGAAMRGDAVAGPMLWNSGISAAALSGVAATGTTDFTPDAVFSGVTAGLWKDGLMDGSLYAVYKTAANEAGWLMGALDGMYDSALGMWKVEGDIAPTVRVSSSQGYDLSGLQIYHDFGYGMLGGAFADGVGYTGNQGSYLQTTFWGKAIGYDEEREADIVLPLRWGIYDLRFAEGNVFNEKPTGDASWNARVGGMGPTQMKAPFFYQADIAGNWLADGTIDGTLSGEYMTPLYLGVLSGPVAGIYDAEGGWIGQSVGTYQVTERLAHSAALGGDWYDGYNNGVGRLYSDNGGYFTDGGFIAGLMGGLVAPWSGDTSFQTMGIFDWYASGFSSGGTYLWSSPLQGKVPRELTESAEAGGSYAGYLSALFGESGYEGDIRAIYLTPADTDGFSAAGILAGSGVTGSVGILAKDEAGEYGYGLWRSDDRLSLLSASLPLATGLDPAAVSVARGQIGGRAFGSFTTGGALENSVSSGEMLYYVHGSEPLPFGVYNLQFGGGGSYEEKPASVADWAVKAGGTLAPGETLPAVSTTAPGYWLADIEGTWNENGALRGQVAGKYITATHLGDIAGGFQGVSTALEAGSGTWIGQSAGSWQGAPLGFVNPFYSRVYQTDGATELITEYNGWMGGTGSLWSGASSVPFTVVGSYQHDQAYSVWEADVEGVGYAVGILPEQEGHEGYYKGFMGGIATAAGESDMLEGLASMLFVDPAGAAGRLIGSLTQAEGYRKVGMFGMEGVLERNQVVADAGILPAEFYSSVWEGYAYGGARGAAGEGVLESDDGPYWDILSLVNHATVEAQPWGIYAFTVGGAATGAAPTGGDPWRLRMGGDGYFGAVGRMGELEGTDTLTDDRGYWTGGVQDGVVREDGTFAGTFGGEFITYNKLGTIDGELLGAYASADQTWEAVSAGAWQGSPTDFGGDWYHSALYDDYGTLGVDNCGNEGIFGFVKRPDGAWNFSAIGSYTDYGSGHEGFGGPYLWSGSLDYYRGSSSMDDGRYVSAFVSAIAKPSGESAGGGDTFGGLAGYTTALYYTPDDAGIIAGDIAGDFFGLSWDEGDGEVGGAWTAASAEGGLIARDMSALIPETWDPSTAVIDYDSASFNAGLTGQFAVSGETRGGIAGVSASGRTMFITWDFDEASASLPFGIYNIRMGGNESVANAYEGRPLAASSDFGMKTGGTGYFGYWGDVSPGYWLADIEGTWGAYADEAEHGTIAGTLGGYYLTPTHLGTIDGKLFGLYTEDGSDANGGYGTWIASSVGAWQGNELAFSGKLEDATEAFLYTDYYDGIPSEGWDPESSAAGLMGSLALPWETTGHTFVALGSYVNPNNRRLWWPWTPEGEVKTSDGGRLLGDMIAVMGEQGTNKGFYHALFVRPEGEEGYKAGYLGYNLDGKFYPWLGASPDVGSGMWELEGTRYAFYEQPLTGVAPEDLAWYNPALSDLPMYGSIAGDIASEDFTSYKDSFAGQRWGIWSTTMAGGAGALPGNGWSARAGGSFGFTTTNAETGYWLADLGGSAWTDGNVAGAIAYRYITDRSRGTLRGDLLGAYAWNDVSQLYDWQAAAGGVYGGSETGAVEESLSHVAALNLYPGTVVHQDPEDPQSQVVVNYGAESMDGLLGGAAALWSATTSAPAQTTAIGSYNGASFSSFAFGGNIGSRDYALDADVTYDGGAYRGYLSGVGIDGALDARMVGLYINPSGEAGVLRGNMTGELYPEIGMFAMDGGMHPDAPTASGMTPAGLAANTVDAYSAYGGTLAASLGADGTIKTDILSFETMAMLKTDAAYGLPWGIYRQNLAGRFEPAASGTSWSGEAGGSATFGSFEHPTYGCQYDAGYWLADAATGAWEGGAFSGTYANGRYITATRMGSLAGDLFGVYNVSDSTWQGFALGTWSGADLSHGATIDGASLTGTARYYTGEYSYGDGGGYTFSYFTDNSGHLGYYRPGNAADPDGENYEATYYPDGAYSRYDYITTETTSGRWDDGHASLAFLGTPLDEASNPVLVSSSDRVDVRQDGYISNALFGGADALWGATDSSLADVTMLGEYTASHTSSETWSATIGSANAKDATATTYDGGAYEGYLAGTIRDGALAARFLGLYLNPSGNAGILRGNMTGELYPEIGMFAMDGGMHPDAPTVSEIGILPADFANAAAEAPCYTAGRLGAALGATGSVWTDNLTMATMSLLQGTTAQPWGIYRQDMSGRFVADDAGATGWSGKAGGAGVAGYYFRSDESAWDDTGFWLADAATGVWEGGAFSGTYANGRYITGTRMGSLTGDLFGVYNASDSTWQGFGLGTWSGTDLAYVSDVTIVGMAGGYMNMLLGGTDSLWTGSDIAFKAIGSVEGGDGLWNGPIHSDNYIDNNTTTYDGGAYRGFIGMATDGADKVNGGLVSLYMDNAGNVGWLSGSLVGDSVDAVGMIDLDGSINRHATGVAPQAYVDGVLANLVPENFYDGVMETGFRSFWRTDAGVEPGVTSMQENEAWINTEAPDWGIWQARIEGGVTAPGPDHWSWTMENGGAGYGETHWSNFSNVAWAGTPATSLAMVEGDVAGAKADWISATTWVNGGAIKGVFDPIEETVKPWRAIAQGTMMETAAFMAKINEINGSSEALQAFYDLTKIPCFQVGSTDLRGSGSVDGGAINLGGAADAARGILNAAFLAPSTGGMPQVWASGSVVGGYTGTPTGGTVSLAGFAPGTQTANGIAANFNIQQFWANTWGATVTNGSVPANVLTGAAATTAFTFTGGAAGKVDATAGTFTGTAAGVVAPAPAP